MMDSFDIISQQDREYEESLRLDILREAEEARIQKDQEDKERIEKEDAILQEKYEDDEKNRLSPRSLREKRLMFFNQNVNIRQDDSMKQCIKRCVAISKKNRRCKLNSHNGSFCHIHMKNCTLAC